MPPAQLEIKDLVREQAQYVWRALRHLGIRESDLEDAAQDVFVVLHRRLADFRGESSIKTFIYGICVRVASEHRRRAHVVREIPNSSPPTATEPDSQFEQVARREALRCLGRILDLLDEDKRAVFVLYELEELGMTEVAQAVGCPLQTAYSRLHAARRIVTEAAAQYATGGPGGNTLIHRASTRTPILRRGCGRLCRRPKHKRKWASISSI